VITQNGTTLSSSVAANNQWYLNGVAIPGATGQTYAPTRSGTYRVDVTLSSGCISQSADLVYVIFNTTSAGNDIGLTVFPNPASTQLNVVFASKAAVPVNLSLINSLGQTFYSEKSTTAGNYSTQINVGNYAAGTYIVKILLGGKLYSQKVIISR
jgi:hypothetical protein